MDNKQEWKDKRFIGTLSHIFEQKMGYMDFKYVVDRFPSHDFIYFIGGPGTVYTQGSSYTHPNLFIILEKTLDYMKLPRSYLTDTSHIVYCNYCLFKPWVLEKYLSFLYEVKRFWTLSKEMQDLLWQDATYNQSKLSKEDLIRKFGVPYYPHFCFVLERLIGIYVSHLPNISIGLITPWTLRSN
jgi:hypothetical protein